MLPSGWDSEEEEARLVKEVEKNGDGEGAASGAGGKSGNEASLRQREAKRPVGGVWMAGFVLPGLQEFEDVGEAALRMESTFRRAGRREMAIEEQRTKEVRVRRFVKTRRPRMLLDDDAAGGASAGVLGAPGEMGYGERPRLNRKSGAGRGRGRGRGSRGGRGGGRAGALIKTEPARGRNTCWG